MVNNKIIVINGMGTSGKSTFVTLCKEINNHVVEISTIDFVKSIAKLCGWDGIKTEKNRRFLSDLKDLISDWDDVPNKKIDEYILNHSNQIIFINAREPENIDYFKNKYNATTCIVKNNRVKNITTNHADMNVFNYNYDMTIENNGTIEELFQKAKEFMQNIENRKE